MRFLAIIIILSLAGCGSPLINPITTVPAMILGAYDSINKREQWLKYANKGDVYAQYELAESYCCSHTEGSRDLVKSLQYYCQAAKNGYAKAQVKLGSFYEGRTSLGDLQIARDNSRAYMWYSLASRRINREAIGLKKALKQSISAQDLRDSNYLLSNYKAVPCDALPLEWVE